MPPSPEQPALNPEEEEKDENQKQSEEESDERSGRKSFEEAVEKGPVNGSDGHNGMTQNLQSAEDALPDHVTKRINERESDESEEGEDSKDNN